MEPDILTPDEQRALTLRGAREAAKLAKERYDIDLARVARDPAEAVALVRAYAADALMDPSSNRMERGAAATLLLNTTTAEDRKGKKPAEDANDPARLGAPKFELRRTGT